MVFLEMDAGVGEGDQELPETDRLDVQLRKYYVCYCFSFYSLARYFQSILLFLNDLAKSI